MLTSELPIPTWEYTIGRATVRQLATLLAVRKLGGCNITQLAEALGQAGIDGGYSGAQSGITALVRLGLLQAEYVNSYRRRERILKITDRGIAVCRRAVRPLATLSKHSQDDPQAAAQ